MLIKAEVLVRIPLDPVSGDDEIACDLQEELKYNGLVVVSIERIDG